MLETLWNRLAAYALPWDTDCNPHIEWEWSQRDMRLIRDYYYAEIKRRLAPDEMAVMTYGRNEYGHPKWEWLRAKAPNYYSVVE